MIKIISPKILIIIFLFSTFTFSQVRIGDFQVAMYGFDKLDKKTVDRLKDKTVKFILPDFYSIKEYETILNQVWTFTPYEIILTNNFNEDDVKEGDVLAQFLSAYARGRDSEGFVHTKYFCTLELSIVEKIIKKKKDYLLNRENTEIATIYFTQSPHSRFLPPIDGYQENEFFPPVKNVDYLSNFRLGYLKNFLNLINSSITDLKSIDIYDDFVLEELKNLKMDTLYIDKSFDNGAFPKLDYKQNKWPKLKDLIEKYNYKYKFVDYKEIEEMIMNDNSSNFYYLMYNQIVKNKIITILNGKNGQIIYQNHSSNSLFINDKDIKKINSAIEKLN